MRHRPQSLGLALAATTALATAACGATPAPAPSPPSPPPTAPVASDAPPAASAAPGGDVTVRYDILLAGHVAGQSIVTHHADGSYDEDFEFNDRGRGPKVHSHSELAPDGLPVRVELSGHDYYARKIHELSTCGADKCKWDNDFEHAEGGRGFYVAMNANVHLGEALLRAARKAGGSMALLPGGTARTEQVAEATVTRKTGETKHVVAWQTSGMGLTPSVDWFDDDGTYFGSMSDWGSTVREGWDDTPAKLLAVEKPLAQKRREAIAKSVAHRPAKGLAVVHARLFDPAKRAATDDVTIVVEGNRVKAVGPKLAPPAGFDVIDAKGKTVLPGLWDMHVHLGEDDGLLDLAQGITTVRDLGNDVDASLARRARWDAGSEIGPRVILAGLIDGPGPYQGPTKILVSDEAAARAAVDDLAAKGYAQIKIYSSVKPELVPVIVKEAHAKGLRVSGHVPAGMIAEDAVKAGFDELQHVNFLVLDLVGDRSTETRTPLRFTLPAEKAGDIDLDAPRTKALVDLLVARHTVIDSTLNVFEDMFTVRPDHPSQVIAPVLSRLPVQVQRGATSAGLPVPEGMDAKYKASFKKCEELVKRLWDRHVTLVAGTDNFTGFALHRELELYSEAGIPNADVLALATLGAARVMKRDKSAGSVAPGKDADLVIIDGDPLAHMRDVRNVITVVKDGTVIDARAAQGALSIAPPP